MSTNYDCTADVIAHQAGVQRRLARFSRMLDERAAVHDASKLQEPEKSTFDEWKPKLAQLPFGSEEYKQALAAMGEGLQHHYQNNNHHPEHYPNGINGMTLLDVVEMFCDWATVADEKQGPIDIDYLTKRFNISDQLADVFVNTWLR